jgi:hypothetical protein
MWKKWIIHSIVSISLALSVNSVQAAFSCADEETLGIPQLECEALVAIYDALNGDNWSDNTNWKTENPVDGGFFRGSWHGVTVENGHVIGIGKGASAGLMGTEVIYPNFVGSIPPEIVNLAFLESLVLSEGQLTNIPPEIGSLANLEYLNLSNSQIAGSIPPELGNLSNLTDLKLYQNQLTGSIPSEFGNLTQLDILDLSNNKLTGSIPANLNQLTNLTILRLSNNQLTGSFPSELSKLENISSIDVSNNQLTSISSILTGNSSSLLGLDLSNNKLTTIPLALVKNFSNLNSLELSNNQLKGTIPSFLTDLNLTVLKLDSNNLTGSIPTQFSQTNLKSFIVDNNYLSGNVSSELASFFTNLKGFGFLDYSPPLSIKNNCLSPTDSNIRSIFDEKDPEWSSTQTNCTLPTTITDKLTGISTRAYVGNTAENYMYIGITTSGDAGATKKVAVQAVGKGLIAAGLNTALDAQLQIKSFPDQILIDKNNAWQNHARAAELLALGQTPADITDAATLTDLTMGNFTANVMPKDYPGVGIVSVYDMDTASSSRLTGISTRAYVGNTPENYMYAGITVEGNVRVIIQAVGQGLVPLGVNTALDAKVEVYTFPDRRLVASNDNWQDGVDAVTLQQNGHAPASPFDAALYVNLTTGSYTIDVKPSGYGNPGVGLVSAYEVQ